MWETVTEKQKWRMRQNREKEKEWMKERKKAKGREHIDERENEWKRGRERTIVEHISITFLKFGPRFNQRLCVQMVKCVLGCGPASGWGLADA